MNKSTTQELQEKTKRYCDHCLRMAVDEYLSRASNCELKHLIHRIEQSVDLPFQEQVCEAERDVDRYAS